MIVLDADVLGRERTGDETYVSNLLRELPRVAPDLRFGAVTRHPELVPDGVEPLALPARVQEVRMAWSLPRLLRQLKPELAHFQHALPLGWHGRSVVTLHDLSFEAGGNGMGLLDRLTFRLVVPRAARSADHVLVVSQRTRDDVQRLYGVDPASITVTPNGVDPAFSPGGARTPTCSSWERSSPPGPACGPLALREPPVSLVVVSPEKDRTSPQSCGPEAPTPWLRGQGRAADLYRGAVALVLPSRHEGSASRCSRRGLRHTGRDLRRSGAAEVAARRATDVQDAIENASAFPRPDRTREALLVEETAPNRRGVQKGVVGMRVSAVVVSHDGARDLEESLPVLRPQVDELLVIANIPGSVSSGIEALENDHPLGYAANLNRGLARTSGDAMLAANPDAVPEPGAVAALRDFMQGHPRCGVAGPRMVYPDGRPQPSRRRFPTVTGTIVRRTPLRRLLRQRRHYHLGEAQPSEPVQCDWMLGGFLLLRRSMLEAGGFDEGFRLYGEDVDLQYRAMRAGWERWYVPARSSPRPSGGDRPAAVDATDSGTGGDLRFVRKHPERLRAL